MQNVILRLIILIILCICVISGCAGGNHLVVTARIIDNVTFDERLEPNDPYSPLPDTVYRHYILSPDHLKFAYNTADGVYIHDMAEGVGSRTADKTFIVYGWSPDSSRLLLGKDYRILRVLEQ